MFLSLLFSSARLLEVLPSSTKFHRVSLSFAEIRSFSGLGFLYWIKNLYFIGRIFHGSTWLWSHFHCHSHWSWFRSCFILDLSMTISMTINYSFFWTLTLCFRVMNWFFTNSPGSQIWVSGDLHTILNSHEMYSVKSKIYPPSQFCNKKWSRYLKKNNLSLKLL